MTVYERIESLRKSTGLSQGKLEKELGFSNGSVSKWKTSTPTPERLQKLADFFGVTVDYLMNGKEETPEAKKPTLSNNEELNVINDVDEIMKRIRNNETVVLRFNGEDYSGDEDEDKLLRDSLLSLCRAAKIKKKQEGFGE